MRNLKCLINNDNTMHLIKARDLSFIYIYVINNFHRYIMYILYYIIHFINKSHTHVEIIFWKQYTHIHERAC